MTDVRPSGAEEEDARLGLEAGADVAAQGRPGDGQRPGPVVAYEEDRAAALVGVIVGHRGAADGDGVAVAVGVDRAPAAAAAGPVSGRIRAMAHRASVGEPGVEDGP